MLDWHLFKHLSNGSTMLAIGQNGAGPRFRQHHIHRRDPRIGERGAIERECPETSPRCRDGHAPDRMTAAWRQRWRSQLTQRTRLSSCPPKRSPDVARRPGGHGDRTKPPDEPSASHYPKGMYRLTPCGRNRKRRESLFSATRGYLPYRAADVWRLRSCATTNWQTPTLNRPSPAPMYRRPCRRTLGFGRIERWRARQAQCTCPEIPQYGIYWYRHSGATAWRRTPVSSWAITSTGSFSLNSKTGATAPRAR